MDTISVVIKNILANVAGSLNTKIPKKAVTNAIKKPKYHKTDSLPVVSLALPRQNAKPVSNKPAITNIIQFMQKKLNQKYTFVNLTHYNNTL